MKKTRSLSTVLTIFGLTILLTSCANRSSADPKKSYTYRGIVFDGSFSADAKAGIRDGCETARGVYTKSHNRFNNSNDYYNGWFLGRNKCRKLLRIDENGDLIL